jgi:polyhydroxyalkanoate synthesis regulator phasin
MFSALRQGAPIYILEKGETPSIKIGQVESVTQPRPKYATYNPTIGLSGNMETLVDITVKLNGDKKEFVGIPSNLSIHGYGDIVISESKEAMISEVDGMLQSSKSIVDSVEYHKKMITQCEEMLKQLNPAYAKEQERDGAIDSLKSEVETLRKEISRMTSLLAKSEAI